MLPANRPLVKRASDLLGIPKAFRPGPLRAEEMEFYAESLNRQRANHLQKRLADDLLGTAEQALFFRGVIYGNRGAGKSTEINRLVTRPDVAKRFLVVRLDALDELNPETFSVADVLLLLAVNVVESCERHCREQNEAFHAATTMIADMQSMLAPFFSGLRGAEQTSTTKEAGSELDLKLLKLSLRVEGQKSAATVAQRERLTHLTETLSRIILATQQVLGGKAILVIGENFDKEQIPAQLLEDTFVQYATVIRDLPLHLLFTLPVPFVYGYADKLPFRRENRYPIYDVPIFNKKHQRDESGCAALLELIDKRADRALFDDRAFELLLRASGGDLYLLFAMIVRASQLARYRHEDQPESENRMLHADARGAVLEQYSTFKNEMGTAPRDRDETSWEDKRAKLRQVYEQEPSANIPDRVLYQLLRRRAVLFCNGEGRYAVHPLAVEMLREQLKAFEYQGGGLDIDS